MLDEDGCFRSHDVRVYARRSTGEESSYQVVGRGTIFLETSSLLVANGIAATFAALIPDGERFRIELVLDSLRTLTEARQLLSRIVTREAEVVSAMGAETQKLGRQLYGREDL